MVKKKNYTGQNKQRNFGKDAVHLRLLPNVCAAKNCNGQNKELYWSKQTKKLWPGCGASPPPAQCLRRKEL